MRNTLIFMCISATACSAPATSVIGTESQAVTASDYTSFQTTAMSGAPSQHFCLSANGALTSGTPVLLAPCGASQIGTSFVPVPSSQSATFGQFLTAVRIEAKNNDGSMSGFCIAPGANNASTALASCSMPSTAINYQYGAIYNSSLCLQSVENGAGQLPWVACTSNNTGWEPVNLTCYLNAPETPGPRGDHFYANILASGAIDEELDGPFGQPTPSEQFCVSIGGTASQGANLVFSDQSCTASLKAQEQGVVLDVSPVNPTLFAYGRVNLAGLGIDGAIFDNAGNFWQESSAPGQQLLVQGGSQASPAAWEMVCAGH